MPSIAIKNTSFTLPTTGVVPAAMIGGTPNNPLAPIVSLVTTAPGMTGSAGYFAASHDESVLYFTDAYGDVYQKTVASGAVVQLYNANSTYGNSIRATFLIISIDDAFVYLGLNNGIILRITTAAPSSNSIYAGQLNTFGGADGVGTAATFSAGVGFAGHNAADNSIYFNDNGNLRKINLSTALVTTVKSGNKTYNTSMHISTSGFFYGNSGGTLHKVNLLSSADQALSTTFTPANNTNYEWIPDSRKPSERCVYAVNNTSGSVLRYDANLATFTTVATLPNPLAGYRGALFINNHLLVWTTGGVYVVNAS